MEVALPIILFVAGFVVGGFVVWQMKQRREDRRRSEEALEAAFGNLSRQALTENQTQFLSWLAVNSRNWRSIRASS